MSTVQIGITLIGILTGIYSGQALAGRVASLLVQTGMSATWADTVAQALIVVIVTYLTIVLGELVPKRIGMSLAESVSRMISRPMYVLSLIASPFVWILSKSTELLVNLWESDKRRARSQRKILSPLCGRAGKTVRYSR